MLHIAINEHGLIYVRGCHELVADNAPVVVLRDDVV